MARGFESKSVADQQAEAENRRARRRAPAAAEASGGARRRSLELARADAVHRIEQATDERYRAMLQQALAALDAQLSALR